VKVLEQKILTPNPFPGERGFDYFSAKIRLKVSPLFWRGEMSNGQRDEDFYY
jgi:hypothetical protein